MSDSPKRLIDLAFPHQQTSLDSVYEKKMRHEHISNPVKLAHALIVSSNAPEDLKHRDKRLEASAKQVAISHEKANGAIILSEADMNERVEWA